MNILNDLELYQQLIIISILSLMIGSFFSLLTYRINKDQGFIFTRSKCPSCNKALRFYNLIPLFSWILQFGKCSNCKSKISIRYPLIELAFLLFFHISFFSLGQIIDYKLIFIFIIASILIYMCIIDLEHYYIPDLSQYLLISVITIFIIMQTGEINITNNLLSGFCYLGFGLGLWLFFYYGASMEAIGIDDLKFFFIAGFALTLNSFLLFMLLSGISGLIFGSLWQFLKKDESFPFAPSICFSLYICLIIDNKFNMIDEIGKLLF